MPSQNQAKSYTYFPYYVLTTHTPYLLLLCFVYLYVHCPLKIEKGENCNSHGKL